MIWIKNWRKGGIRFADTQMIAMPYVKSKRVAVSVQGQPDGLPEAFR
jgi:hypothetical protein